MQTVRSSGRWIYPRGVAEPPARLAIAGPPLRLFERGEWNPAQEYWGELHGTVAVSLVAVIVGGARPEFEFEQLLPGGDDPEAEDPILDAMDLRDRGDGGGATRMLEDLVAWDARCLDAHAHLGMLAFAAGDLDEACAHYATGVEIAERSFGATFDGVLRWGQLDNRPFLRCLHGLTLTLWRLDRFDEAETLCWTLLWLNPGDNQGASELLPAIAAREAWPGRSP